MVNNIQKKSIILLIAFLSIFIIVVVSPLFIADGQKISAKDGKDIADNVAKNWHTDSIFVYLGSMKKSDVNGFAKEWFYVYYSPSSMVVENNVTKYELVYIYVDTKGYKDMSEMLAVESGVGTPAKNWTLDNTDAAKIAKNNPTIISYLSRYSNADTGYGLQVTDKYPDRPVWHIIYSDWGFLDDPHNAQIFIDATTGEVLYVEADIPSGPTLYETVCLPPVIAAMTVLFLLIFVCGRFSSSLALGFSIFLLPVLYLRIYYSTLLFTLLTVIFWFILWWRVKKLGEGEGGVEVRRRMQAVTWVLAGDYFGLLLARFLLLPYTHPTLLWVLFILLNASAIAVIADEEDRLGLRGLLRSMRK